MSGKQKILIQESAAKYARNNREIAKALALPIKPKMLAEIGEWLRRDDFPKKAVSAGRQMGWLIADLRAFFDKITPELARKKLQAAMADPERKISPGEFNKLVDLSGGKIAATADSPPPGNLGGTLTLGGKIEPPEIIEGLTRLATWIQDYFKIPCSKQTLKNWQTETPPFPGAVSADYRYQWSEVKAWVERYKVKPMQGNGRYADLLVKLEPERIQNELEEIEHDRMMRALEAGAYLKKADVARACQGIGKTINGVINNRLELRLRVAALERLKLEGEKLPVTDEQAQRLVNIFCALGSETSAVLKAELRTALNALATAEETPPENETTADISDREK